MARLRVAVALALLAETVGVGSPLAAQAKTTLQVGAQALHSQQLAQAVAQAPRRLALVIGNGAYVDGPLANAVNDAKDVTSTLKDIGFQVMPVFNADKRTIDKAVEAFSRRLSAGDIGLFYFSGHGIQVDGENYIVPINARLNRQADAEYDAIPLGKVIDTLKETSATAKIIILDACRNNPFYRRWRSTARGSANRGLATTVLPSGKDSQGILIAFSTAPGEFAKDRIGNSPNSPFTTHLLNHLKTPNLEVGKLFRLVRENVAQATNNEQIPWESNSLMGGDMYLNPRTPSQDQLVKPPLPNPPRRSNNSESGFVNPVIVRQSPPKPRKAESPPYIPIGSSPPKEELMSTSPDLSLIILNLKRNEFHKADLSTKMAILRNTGLSDVHSFNVLSSSTVANLSCYILLEIDTIWEKYTYGRHGFRVQSELFKGSFSDFEALAGWRVGGFLIRAPGNGNDAASGYFPREISNGSILQELLQRFNKCRSPS